MIVSWPRTDEGHFANCVAMSLMQPNESTKECAFIIHFTVFHNKYTAI